MSFLDTRPAALDHADPDDALAQFRCDHPREVLSLLQELRDAVTPVSLSSPDGANLGATVWTVDSDHQRLTLDVEAGDPRLPALVEANEVNAVAYLKSVKLQFDLQDLVLVRSARATALQSQLPRSIYRFQRRATFRVRPLDRGTPIARFRHPALPDMMLSLRILDISIGGCALLLPADVPPLPLDVALHGVVLELDVDTGVVVSLRLHHASSILSHAPGLRLGCELLKANAGIERALQRYIDHTQKRRRLLSLD